MIQSKLLKKFKNIRHYFLDRFDSLNCERFNIDKTRLASAEQVHSDKVAVIRKINSKTDGIDGIVTNKHFFLTIRTADCLPIFFYEPQKQIIAAVHAGWKGLAKKIIKNTIKTMVEMGSKKEDILSAIGPHIGSCCYSIPQKRLELFVNKNLYLTSIGHYHHGKWHMALGKIATMQMLELGVRKGNIDDVSICTYCDGRFYSFRRDGLSTGRMMNVIGLVGSV